MLTSLQCTCHFADPVRPQVVRSHVGEALSIPSSAVVVCSEPSHVWSGTNTMLCLLRVAAVATCPGSPLARCRALESCNSCVGLTGGQPHSIAAAANSSSSCWLGTCHTCCLQKARPHCDQQQPTAFVPKVTRVGSGPASGTMKKHQQQVQQLEAARHLLLACIHCFKCIICA